jgi:CheY-like chemotaxis protein
MAERKRFGEVLIEEGVIDADTLALALAEQRRSGKRLGQVLEEQQVVTERDIALALARQFGLKTVQNISQHKFPQSLLDLIDSEIALKKLIFPLRIENKTMYLAMVNPLDMETLDTLSFGTGLRIVPYLTTPQEIHTAINSHYLKALNQPPKGSWWRILVLDNQELSLSVSATALERVGYEVIKCSQADGALTLINQKHPHLVVADVAMAGLNGVDLFNSLQNNIATKHIPVIACSNRATAPEEVRYLDMGFVDFIAKPINALRLVARVKRVLRLCYSDNQLPTKH